MEGWPTETERRPSHMAGVANEKCNIHKHYRANRPWKLMDYEEYTTRSEAVRREIFLKTGQKKERPKKRFNNE